MSSVTEWVEESQGRVLARRVQEAHRLGQRLRGLLGREGLAPDEGLWLKPCRQVHTWFMCFAIDVVFLDAALEVVAVCRNLPPWRLSPFHRRARSCLELAAGTAGWVRPGHRLRFTRKGS
jgi:hypothetical protein